ncbi:cytochrome P450 [Frankia sp. AgB32]|uniref:cytochrome P450 n=1 Tax=Frankia sp. AgB32 TaxID=631119 RepID=UPI00200E493F|nr:cytochrome P450 [Frankia sp. AgB32]MCK9897001.1 cytochrome P450 [Frankia sp. AgB32]
MTDTRPVPLPLQRAGFGPAADLVRIRDDVGVSPAETAYGAPAHLVSRYADARLVLADTRRFSSEQDASVLAGRPLSEAERRWIRAGNLLIQDPPEHTRLRRMLTPEFTTRRMSRLEPRLVQIIDEALAEMERAGRPAELISMFMTPVPALALCELLGVPYADRHEFQARSARLFDSSASVEERVRAQIDNRLYMVTLVERATTDPGEDILGMLVREHGDELGADELSGIATLLLVAGQDSTASMLALGTLALLRHPDQLARVRDDPAVVVPAVEELLRWATIVPVSAARTATTEVEIAGRHLPAGERVVVSLPAANRDPALLDDPDRFDITRGSSGHLAFGHGAHHCLGAPLARMLMRLAIPALLRRLPGLALTLPFEEIRFRSADLVYGPVELPVTW